MSQPSVTATPVSESHNTPQKGGLPWKMLLKIGISLALMSWLFFSTGIENTLKELSEANLWYIPLSVAIYVGAQIFSAYRWQALAKALDFKLSIREFFDYYMLGMYFNLFLPSAIGGDVSKVFYLAKATDRKKRDAGITVLADRGTGLVALCILTAIICLSPVANPFPNSLRYTLIGLPVLGFTVLFALRLVSKEKIAAFVERYPKLGILTSAWVYWHDSALLTKTVLVSMLCHASMILIHVLICMALGINVPVLYLILVYGVVSLAGVIPISFNGIGLREGAYKILLTREGVPDHTALAFGLYWFIISTVTSLVGGLILIKGHYKTPPAEELEEAA